MYFSINIEFLDGYHKQSVVMSETETEEEILFDSSKKQGKNEKQALISNETNFTNLKSTNDS